MKKNSRVYEWTATGKTEEGRETIRLKGEIEVETELGKKPTSGYVRRAAEVDATEAAYKYDLDPDTVEVTDIYLIYE